MLQRKLVAGVLLSALPILSGCGPHEPALVETEGTVTYQSQPVPQASVTFVPEEGGVPATGTTDANGKFALGTQGRPGALPGSHGVSVFAVKDSRPLSASDLNRLTSAEVRQIRRPLIPERYFNTQTSGLTAVVREGQEPNEFAFELTD